MSNRTLVLTDQLYEYLCSVSLREDSVLRRLREETARDPMARMQIAPEQGQFMAFLVELIQARLALEIGVYTGYSSLCIARALQPGGRLTACDVNEEWTAVARRYWEEAGVAERIELRLAPAMETLDSLLAGGKAGSFDFAFIDADKENYPKYLERVLELLAPGGLMAVDNVLWGGQVADDRYSDPETRAIRVFNETLAHDERVSLSLVPIADGLTLARKRGE